MSDTAVRVVLVEDHQLVRDALAGQLGRLPGVEVVAAQGTLAGVGALDPLPDLLLLDLDLDGQPADDREVAVLCGRGMKVIVVSAMAQPQVVRAMVRAGVAALVDKRQPFPELAEVIQHVVHGGTDTSHALAAALADAPGHERPQLSAQEERALVLYASGLKMSAVARRMGVSDHTAKEYIDRVRDKYATTAEQPRSKTELQAAAIRDGYLSSP